MMTVSESSLKLLSFLNERIKERKTLVSQLTAMLKVMRGKVIVATVWGLQLSPVCLLRRFGLRAISQLEQPIKLSES